MCDVIPITSQTRRAVDPILTKNYLCNTQNYPSTIWVTKILYPYRIAPVKSRTLSTKFKKTKTPRRSPPDHKS